MAKIGINRMRPHPIQLNGILSLCSDRIGIGNIVALIKWIEIDQWQPQNKIYGAMVDLPSGGGNKRPMWVVN